jgi:fluoroquinolone transport system permease protein
MNIIRAYRALGPIDAHSVRRDALLRWLVFLPLILVIFFRFVLPLAAQLLWERLVFDLRPYYPLAGSFLYLIMPMLVGMVLGFLLLDQRDDHTLMALQVTPLSLNGYLAYRISLPLLIALVMTLITVPLAGLGPVNPLAHLAAALCAAPLAPMFALFTATFAQNKVQGFAVMKAASVVNIPPFIAYFIHSGWQWLFGLVPTYWPVKVYWLLQAGNPQGWLALGLGLGYETVVIVLLLRWFNAVMHAGQ